MSIQKQQPAQTITERTHFVGINTPASGGASIYILRQNVYADGTVMNLPGTFNKSWADIKKTDAAAAYLTACQSAQSLDDLFAAKKNLFDALTTESEGKE